MISRRRTQGIWPTGGPGAMTKCFSSRDPHPVARAYPRNRRVRPVTVNVFPEARRWRGRTGAVLGCCSRSALMLPPTPSRTIAALLLPMLARARKQRARFGATRRRQSSSGVFDDAVERSARCLRHQRSTARSPRTAARSGPAPHWTDSDRWKPKLMTGHHGQALVGVRRGGIGRYGAPAIPQLVRPPPIRDPAQRVLPAAPGRACPASPGCSIPIHPISRLPAPSRCRPRSVRCGRAEQTDGLPVRPTVREPRDLVGKPAAPFSGPSPRDQLPDRATVLRRA